MGCIWSASRSEVEVPQARRIYEERIITPRVPVTYKPSNYVPTSYVHPTYVPATRVPSPAVSSVRVPARVLTPTVSALRVPVPITNTESQKHCYGEYKCVCGRYWNSALSWPKAPQGCEKCKRDVYPHTQRELRPDDYTKDHEAKHVTELCPKCKELGRHCGYLRRPTNNNKARSKYNNHCQYDAFSNTKRKRLGYHCSNSNRYATRGFKAVKTRY